MIEASKVVFPDVMLKLEWPVAACTQCAGELVSVTHGHDALVEHTHLSVCVSCGYIDLRTIVKVVKGEVVAFS